MSEIFNFNKKITDRKMTKEQIDEMERKALSQFRTGKYPYGKDGTFAPLLKGFLEKALEAEMEDHLVLPPY